MKVKFVDDLITAVKKDKKKGVFMLLALAVIGFGIFMAVNGDGAKENTIAENKHVDALPIPELSDDSDGGLDKENAYFMSEEEYIKDSLKKAQYNLGEDDYFGAFEDEENKEDGQTKHNESFNDVFGSGSSTNKSSGHKTSSSNTNNNNQTYTQPEQTAVVDTKRRRIPVDNGTMSNGSSSSSNSQNTNMIKAVVSNGNKPVKKGSTIRIRLSESCYMGGISVPKNTVLSGICSFTSERVKIAINSIRINNQLVQTNYSVYEMDGIEGVYIPGGIKSEIVKDGANEVLDEGGANVTTPIGTFGVGSIKKGANDPSVLIRDGHKIILKLK